MLINDQQIIDQCTKKPDTLVLHNVEIENLTIKEHKEVTKQESQQAFDQLFK
jgi:hypothetical protein